jgi:hypothetical protein
MESGVFFISAQTNMYHEPALPRFDNFMLFS